MQHLINGLIGAGLENDPDDIRVVRGTLNALNGDEIIPEQLSGFIDDDLDADIRSFQQNAGLVEDGRLTPKGETERNLISRITGEGIDVAAPGDAVLRRSVGDGGENDPADVVAMKRVLGTSGHLKYDRTAPPSPFIDAKTVAALTEFQNDTKLLPDGRADPDGETIASIRDLLEENPAGRVQDETQLAFAPALIPLFMFLGRAALTRAAPHILKSVPGVAAGMAAGEAVRSTQQNERDRRREPDPGSEFAARPSEGSKLVNIPPDPDRFGGGKTVFPPKDPDGNDGKLEGRPTDPVTNAPTVFPLPENPENLVQIFPGRSDKIERPLIIERKGNETTRGFNAELARLFEKLGDTSGVKLIHIGGSRDADGAEVPETHLNNRDTGGLKGGSFPDITFEIPGLQKLLVYINSADTYADGVSLTTREKNAAENIEYNMEDNAVLITIPKLRANQTIDIEALGEMLKPVINDLKKRADGDLDKDAVERWIKTLEKLPTK